MTSLITHTAAMVALHTLNVISTDLKTTNSRVSTGLRIATARDSAAYWAIATTTQSDTGALTTVQDALAIGRATIDVVYTGLDSTRESLQTMKELLVAARQPGVDRTNVQTQIAGLQTDMQNKADAAVINEQNFLSVDSSAAGYNATKSVVAAFERSASGIAISTIDLDISSIALVDPAGGTAAGLLDKDRTVGGTTDNVLAIDISALTDSAADLTTLEEYIGIVDAALIDVIDASNTAGTVLARTDSQNAFISALIDANARATGALIDADMEEESTRLAALQTQQQLSVASLSIANASATSVLALFS
ncbi:flagellin N-terminal helical domain-containing protein [Acuticoccus mangrovi]|uniref:Flagellin n=1 Tax=Acuticoccus mangrovi TaxID=2796142 RepID=A0A934IU78_9HYPH|nr:flagellin [Acuticoccus mangrovi]MBJ3778688.1 flagellin [Acuticoccus mangrovi]